MRPGGTCGDTRGAAAHRTCHAAARWQARANSTWGTSLASGIALTRGAYAGRLMVALRHDCSCGTLRASFVVYSDDHGKSWTGGAEMLLLPKYGGGWTEAQVAELKNGSVLMTSRNFYGRSGAGPAALCALGRRRSDLGGQLVCRLGSAWAVLRGVDPWGAESRQAVCGRPVGSRSRQPERAHLERWRLDVAGLACAVSKGRSVFRCKLDDGWR